MTNNQEREDKKLQEQQMENVQAGFGVVPDDVPNADSGD